MVNRKRNILITGGAGFIGSNFVHYWSRKYPEDKIIVLDKLTYAGCLDNLAVLLQSGKVEFIEADINNFEIVKFIFQKFQIDTVVHFAAESHVDRSITGPEEFVKTNVLGTFTLLQAAKNNWSRNSSIDSNQYRFHHVSTDEVYGMLQDNDPAFTEQTPYAPSSPYSASKAGSDHLVNSFFHTYGLPVTMSNCSNNYGPFHFPEKLIPLSLTNLLRGKEIGIYGSGKNIRDWLFVEDHCLGIDLIIQKGKIGENYNIGGNNEWRNVDVIELMCDTVDRLFIENPVWKEKYPDALASQGIKSRQAIRFIADRAGHDWRYAINAGKISKELGYSPQETFKTGLRKTIQWFLQNDNWWKRKILY